MSSIIITLQQTGGLHARPAARFVRKAASFPCRITIRNVSTDASAANAKSISGVLSQQIRFGNDIEIGAEGDRAEEAVSALVALLKADVA